MRVGPNRAGFLAPLWPGRNPLSADLYARVFEATIEGTFTGPLAECNTMDWLIWAPLVSASLHISEEFLVPPGGAYIGL